MDAKVIWKKRMSFDGSSESGFIVPLGTIPAVGGDNDGFRPIELIAIGLAGCTAMDVISILQKKRQGVSSFEVKVHADRAEDHPKVFTQIVIEYILTGNNLSREAVERAVELSAEKYCPAQAMLKQVAPMELKISIDER
ncbi:MAG TPA: OsmC family protein [Pelolinea sp.]|nr:OsmC family protein [Pelolinea sp.]